MPFKITTSGTEPTQVRIQQITEGVLIIEIRSASRWLPYSVTGQADHSVDVSLGEDSEVLIEGIPFPFYHLEGQDKDDLIITLIHDNLMADAKELLCQVMPIPAA